MTRPGWGGQTPPPWRQHPRFGDYEGPNSGNFSAYLSDSARRSPLPYLFKG